MVYVPNIALTLRGNAVSYKQFRPMKWMIQQLITLMGYITVDIIFFISDDDIQGDCYWIHVNNKYINDVDILKSP